MEDIQNIMQRLSEQKADLYEDEVDVTTSDSPRDTVDDELSDVDIEDVAPPPPPRDSKRHIPGLEPSPQVKRRNVIQDLGNETSSDNIPMLGETNPPPPPAARPSRSSRTSDKPGLYDPSRGFL